MTLLFRATKKPGGAARSLGLDRSSLVVVGGNQRPRPPEKFITGNVLPRADRGKTPREQLRRRGRHPTALSVGWGRPAARARTRARPLRFELGPARAAPFPPGSAAPPP